MKKIVLFLILILFYSMSITIAQYPGQNESKIKVPVKVSLKAYAFNLSDIRLLDSPFKKAMELDQAWLKELDNKRLLHNYRVNAGLRSQATAYGGWEGLDVELRGHSLGHILSALAMMYAATGDTVYKWKGNELVAGLAEVQEALGESGYLSAYPEKFIDRVIAGTPVWAPWYTLHKIYAGLLDMYLLCDDKQALDVVRKMGDWAYNKLIKLDDKQMQLMLRTEFGGMNEAMYNLYSITGDDRYLRLAQKFYHNAVLDPLLNKEDKLDGLHANTQIPKIIGEARGYELTGSEREHSIAEFFHETVLKNHTYVIAGNSDGERFGPAGRLSDRLSDYTTETCNTYNMLKLTRHLFCMDAKASLADYYERALYNHILASQNPDDGMVCYYVTLRPGGMKAFSDKFNSFWCCVGTGFENHSKYGEAIYYKSADGGLYVNLFIPSELNWKEKNIKILQETQYPEESKTSLKISCDKPVSMPVYIRYPGWAKSGIMIMVNGKPITIKGKSGSYICVNRSWKNGDKIEIDIPMSLYTEPMPDNSKRAAILYGPMVLAGELGKGAISNTVYNVPVLVTNGKPIGDWLKPVDAKSLTFRTEGVGRPTDDTLIAFYKIHNQHHLVYWDFFSESEWQASQKSYEAMKKEEAAIENRTIDAVKIGESQSERDHKFEGENSESGDFNGRQYRDARNAGWLSYEMKVLPDQPMELFCTFWGGDGKRSFDILVNGLKLPKDSVENKPNQFINVPYLIPAELTSNKTSITVQFKAQTDSWVNGLFGLKILKKL